jgi:hypothetical protein
VDGNAVNEYDLYGIYPKGRRARIHVFVVTGRMSTVS